MSSSEKSQNGADAKPQLPGAYVTTPPSEQVDDVQTVVPYNVAPPSKPATNQASKPLTATPVSAPTTSQVRRSARTKKIVERYGAVQSTPQPKKNNPPTKKTKKTKKNSQKKDIHSDEDMEYPEASRGRTRAKAPEPEDKSSEEGCTSHASVGITKMRNKITTLFDMSRRRG
jgi:hypothetical protein